MTSIPVELIVIGSSLVTVFNAVILVDLRYRIARLETLHMGDGAPSAKGE